MSDEPRTPAAPSPRAALVAGAASLALWALLASGALAALPAALRLALSFAALVILPGSAATAAGLVPPGGRWLAPAWALAFGVLWNTAALAILHALGRPVRAEDPLWAALTAVAVACCAALAAAARARAGPPPAREASLSGSRVALAVVLGAALLAGIHAGRLGTPVTYYSDSPDHIGTVRRIAQGGDPFPVDAFFRDAGPGGVDPRKGWWHAEVAVIARLARVDAADAWIGLSAWIAPLFVLNAAAMGWLGGGAAGAAATAAALLLVWAGNLQWFPLRKAVFGTFLTDQLAFAAAVGLLSDLASRTRASRLAAVLLAAAAAATHLYAAIQFAVAFGALGVALLARERAWNATLRRFAGTLALMAAACALVLGPRLAHLEAPTNVIHTEPQGLLTLWGRTQVVSIGVLWDWMQHLWLLFPLAWIPLWRHARGNPAALYAFAVSLGVVLVIFDPPVVAALHPVLGYLLMRMVWMVPLATLLGFAVVALARAARGGGPRARRAALALAALALWLAPTLKDAAWTFAAPGRILADELAISPLRWEEPMAWLRDSLPAGQVVLTDPATSYGVPMLAGQYVVSLVDQHSSPNDPEALSRLLEARDALDPHAEWSATRDVIRRRGVTAIVLNDRFTEIPRFNYWAPSPAWFAAARARFDRHPEAFPRLHDLGDFVVYGVSDAALDSLREPAAPRDFVVPWEPGLYPVARRGGPDVPAILRLSFEAREVAPGDTTRAVAEWRAMGPLPAGSYHAVVRFDQDLPGGFSPPAFIGKPARKVFEKLRHARWRFRDDHLPTAGEYGVDLWRPDQVVRDTFTVRVPGDIADGRYRVRIKMIRSPHYPNYRLSDYFFDDDYYTGVEMGFLDVRRGARAVGSRSAASGGH